MEKEITAEEIRTLSTDWWNDLNIRTKWDLFFKHNQVIGSVPPNIGLNLKDICKYHIDNIWAIETKENE